MSDLTIEQQRAIALANARLRAQQSAPEEPPPKPGFLDALTGDLSDMAGGLYGAVKRVVTAPGDALQGKFNALGPEGRERATEMATAISPMSPAARVGELMPMRKVIPEAPTAEELAKATTEGYKKMRESGVSIPAESMSRFVDDLKQKLAQDAHSAATDPKTFAKLEEIASGPRGSTVDIGFLDKFRSKLGEIAGGDESRPATLAIRELDKFLDNLTENDVRIPRQPGAPLELPGGATPGGFGPREAIESLKTARGNAAAGFRSDAITGLGESAERRAAASNSGQNIGNTIRQRLASLLDKSKDTRGFSDAELSAADRISRGTAGTNTARYVGNLLGGGGGLGQALTTAGGVGIGAAAGGVPGALAGAMLPVVGAGARMTANAMTKNQLSNLDRLIRQRSPLHQERVNAAGMEPVVSDRAAALARLLALTSQEQTQ